MEHEWIMVKAKEVACIGRFLKGQQRIPVAGPCRGIDPFKDGASGKVTLEQLLSMISGPGQINSHCSRCSSPSVA